jgi:hypothetical protein
MKLCYICKRELHRFRHQEIKECVHFKCMKELWHELQSMRQEMRVGHGLKISDKDVKIMVK